MVVMIFVVVATFFSIKYVAAIIILSPVIGKLRDLAPGGNFSTLHDFKMVLGKNETTPQCRRPDGKVGKT